MKFAVIALALCPVSLAAQAAQSDKGDVTASGQLSVTIAESELTLSLTVPAQEVLGFENQAETDEERAMVAEAMSHLSKPLKLFVLPEETGCETVSANVALSNESFAQQEGSSATLENTEETPPSEVLADYVIVCQSMEALETIQFDYFQCFENAQNLQVQVVFPSVTKDLEVTRATPLLDVSGLK